MNQAQAVDALEAIAGQWLNSPEMVKIIAYMMYDAREASPEMQKRLRAKIEQNMKLAFAEGAAFVIEAQQTSVQ